MNAPELPDWLRREYPFTPKSFRTSRGAAMSFVDEGPRRDEAVVMLHGNPTWSFYYRNLIKALPGEMRCIAPDHVGMGLSEKPEGYDYTLATRIADVEELIASLGLKTVHLVVHDWGGAIGFGYAVRRPATIGRIVVLNTAAFASLHIPWRIAACRTPLLGPLLVRGANGFAGPATWMAMHRRALAAEEKAGYLWPYDSWANRVAVNAFVQDIPMARDDRSWATLEKVEAGLAQFRTRPVLIVWGGRDFCFNDHFLVRWQQILPAAEVKRISDAGHYVLEDARDEVVPVITRFLTAAR